jgi:hypothetical protein
LKSRQEISKKNLLVISYYALQQSPALQVKQTIGRVYISLSDLSLQSARAELSG